MSRTCIPFPDVVPPDAYTTAICRANLPLTFEFLKANVDQGRSVLVHCAGGKDRTGLVLAYYMARREELDAATAIRRLRMTRPEALSAEGWEDMAVELIEGDAKSWDESTR